MNSANLSELATPREELERENAKLREQLCAIQNINSMKAPGWSAGVKVVAIATQSYSCKQGPEIENPVKVLAALTGQNPDTVSNCLHKLEAAGLVEWHQERIPYDAWGNVVESAQNAARWATHSVLYIKQFPQDLPPLSATSQDKRTRRNAATQRAERQELRKSVEILQRLACPHCLSEGTLNAVCTECGSLITSDDPNFDTPNCPPESFDVCNDTTTKRPPLVNVVKGATPETESSGSKYIDTESFGVGTFSMELWLHRRIGKNPALTYQNRPTSPNKYLPLKKQLDIASVLTGRLVPGSCPRLDDGTAWLIGFDVDDVAHSVGRSAVDELADRGLAAFYWQRGDGGHVEVYFNRPVAVEGARAFCETFAPSLANSRECFPAEGLAGRWNACDRQNYSWPLTRLDFSGIVSCPMYAKHPDGREWGSPGWLEGEEFQRIIFEALAACHMDPEQITAFVAMSNVSAAALPDKTTSAQSSDMPKIRAAIHHWCRQNQEAVADLFGLPRPRDRGSYSAIRPDDNTPSVHCDYDGKLDRWTWTDFGTGEKLDALEMYCRKTGQQKGSVIGCVVLPGYPAFMEIEKQHHSMSEM